MIRLKKLNNFLFILFGFQKTKSRVQLLLIILIHAIAWLLFLLLPLFFYPVRMDDNRFWHRELITKILPIALFYINYYFLLPGLFERKRIISYSIAVFAAIVIIFISNVIIRDKLFRSFPMFRQQLLTSGTGHHRDSNRLYRREPTVFFIQNDSLNRERIFMTADPVIWGIPRSALFFTLFRTISTCLFLLLLGGLIRLAYSFIKSQNEKKSLENANLDAELNFLKSQIHPHFLFNTLNSIYAQAHDKSEQTEYSILKLSELLRYVIYESSEEKVLLEKDIRYINNYVDLQRMRLSAKVAINYKVTGQLNEYRIAPLLLISFIENAFKHGISYTQSSVINIEITVFEKTLTLRVSNPLVKTDTFTGGGIGLKNVKRRLDLLYPGKYRLDIMQSNNLYIVNLKIDLAFD